MAEATMSKAALQAIEKELQALTAVPLAPKSKGSANVGPFKVEYVASVDKVQVKARVKVAGLNQVLLSGTLTPKKVSLKGKARTELVKAEITLTARFGTKGRRLTAQAQVCHRRLSGLKVKWRCKKVASAKIVSW